ncbi:MAG: hypothetical protein Q9180_007533, partial [Flavoplaca navasiana]
EKPKIHSASKLQSFKHSIKSYTEGRTPTSRLLAHSSFKIGDEYPADLRSSWILDNTTIHVCNDTIKDRFVKERSSTIRQSTLGGHTIIAYGTIRITTPNQKTVTLTNVAYIPGYSANVFSSSIGIQKGLILDLRNCQLRNPNGVNLALKLNNGHFLIEDNSVAPPTTSATTSVAYVAKGVEDSTSNSIIKAPKTQHQKELAKQHQEELAHEAWQQKHEKLKQLHTIKLREVQAKLHQAHRIKIQSYEQKIQEMQAQIITLSPAPTPRLAHPGPISPLNIIRAPPSPPATPKLAFTLTNAPKKSAAPAEFTENASPTPSLAPSTPISPSTGTILPPSPPAIPILAPTATISYEKQSIPAQAVENVPPTPPPTPPPSYHRIISQLKPILPANLATPHENLYVPPQKRARRTYITIQDLFTKFGST